ncbi:hypothetical protein L4C36_23215 [Photobacterium japonica]|uniref:tetratricopeptide repeat protein n=1 Tax=Photobacterium japonica TaxID=2910235 RepID=UPI003D1389A7
MFNFFKKYKAISAPFLPSVSRTVYSRCLNEYDLSIKDVNIVYGKYKRNLDILLDRTIIDERINDIESATSIAIKLIHEEFILLSSLSRSTEISDEEFIRSTTGKNKASSDLIKYDFFYEYYNAIRFNCRESQYMVANYYEYGFSGIKRNYTKMFQWYERSALNGYIPAMRELSAQYAFRRSDDDTSILWLIKGANLNDAESYFNLYEKFSDGLLKLIGNKKYLYNETLAKYCLLKAVSIDEKRISDLIYIPEYGEDYDREEHYFDVNKVNESLANILAGGKELNLELEFMKMKLSKNQ